MTVQEIVTAKLNNPNITAIMVKMAVDEVEQAIKNYCNIDAVPDALRYTWANMSVDLVLYQVASSNEDIDDPRVDVDMGDVSSVKIGDTTVSLSKESTGSASSTAIKSHLLDLDGIVMNYKDQLNKFRRMVW